MDPSRPVEQPRWGPPSRSSGATRPGEHRLQAGARMQLEADGRRQYIIGCSCGWVSDPCGTEVLAEADGEQHVTLARSRRADRPGPGEGG